MYSKQTSRMVGGIYVKDCRLMKNNHELYSSYFCSFQKIYEELKSSGYYSTNISRTDAEEKLAGKAPGTFLIRDSSSADSIFTATFVPRRMGIKSVNIKYSRGHFMFESSFREPLSSNTVLELIAKQKDPQVSKSTILLLNPLEQTVKTLKIDDAD